MSVPVLVVEDRRLLAEMLAETLRADGYEVEVALRGDEAVRRLQEPQPLLAVLTDLKLPGVDGLGVLRAARASDPQLPVFLITGFATVQTAVEALKLGARDYFTKPLDMDTVLAALWAATEPRRALLAALPSEAGMPVMIGTAPAFQAALTALRRVAPTEAAVLLLGPSGSGKELFARAVHHLSPRRGGPFVAFNCAAVPETLVESELFGHERGAFTGATARHIGRFEQAHGGTLFLDEVGEIPLPTQAKLLRAVEERSISRLGGEVEVTVDARILAATNRDLERTVASGGFRRDLFHRLNVFPIQLPALAERRQDIPPLVLHLAARAATRHGVEIPVFAPAALAAMVVAPWPGNVRELANAVERATILMAGELIGLSELGLDRVACRPALDDPDVVALACRLAGPQLAEFEAFLGVKLA